MLSDKPDIVVATPARALIMLQSKVRSTMHCSKYSSPELLNLIYDLTFLKALNLSTLDSLAIDEADLILSYGHDQDMRSILSAENAYLPTVFQSFLMSATMTKDVEALKGLVLRNPAILRLEEDEDEARNLMQYAVRYDVSKPHLMAALFNDPGGAPYRHLADESLCCPLQVAGFKWQSVNNRISSLLTLFPSICVT